MTSVQIALADRDDYPECVALARQVFGSAMDEGIPAWHMYTSSLYGGAGFVARRGSSLVGFSYTFPARRSSAAGLGWFLVNVVVHPDAQSAGVGKAMLGAIAHEAALRGIAWIDFTTNATSARNLTFYLANLNASIVEVLPAFYVGLIASHGRGGPDGDEVKIRWLVSSPYRPRTSRDRTDIPSRSVWVPGARGLQSDPFAARSERERILADMSRCLSAGLVGARAHRHGGGVLIGFEEAPPDR